MNRVVTFVVLAAVFSGLAGFVVGYTRGPTIIYTTPPDPPIYLVTQTVNVSDFHFTCGPSSQAPWLEGALRFNVTSTYRTTIVAEVAYVGDWTGDTDQTINPNTTNHVVVTWGPGKMQDIRVDQCPNVTVRVWRITQTLEACPNPPC